MRLRRAWLAVVLLALTAGCKGPAPVVATGAGTPPVQRIVTLAPHLAELVFSAGAGDRLVGVVEFSDFPPAVLALPRVGDAFRVDYEAVVALHPDLVIAWTSGNPPEIAQRLRALGLRVLSLDPVTLDDIGLHIAEIGALAGTSAVAGEAASRYAQRLAALRAAAPAGGGLRVFVQLSARPYFTVTDRHFIGQGLRLCGGRNVFGDLPGLTAVVSLESIIEAAPQAIVASVMAGAAPSPLASWQAWKTLPAVRDGRLYSLDADLLSRPGVRILDAIERLCEQLESG